MLSIKNLSTSIGKKSILHSINFSLQKGELHIILWPNGSGKSTLGKTIVWHPNIQKTSGEIYFQNKEISLLSTHERAKKGIFLSHQHPASIEGVSFFELLRASNKESSAKHTSLFRFKKEIKNILQDVNLKEEFLEREFNKGSSGWEQKKSEMTFLLSGDSKLAFLDEIDSGLDFDATKIIAQSIKTFLKKWDTSVILVTHSHAIMNYLEPTFVHIFCNGKIEKTWGRELYDQVNMHGYEKVLQGIPCTDCTDKHCQ